MRIKAVFKYIALILILSGICRIKAQNKIRVTGYYAGWMQGWYNNGHLPSDKIDYGALDYIIHFGLVPNSDGTLDSASNSIVPFNSSSLVSEAHANGKKVLICIGGWGTGDYFRSATSPVRLLFFVTDLVDFMFQRGYDGIDVDWETLEESDSVQYVNFIRLLRAALNTVDTSAILTVATAWQPLIIASVQQYVNQINLMTYDLSGAWQGWVSWYNSPVFSAGNNFPSNGKPVPSVDNMVNEFVAAGVDKSKIAIGIDFYGYIWSGGSGTGTGGVTSPFQSWSQPPSVEPNVPYYQIIDQYFKPQYYRWDPNAEASYLDIDVSCDDSDKFISYDDDRTCRAKVEYAIKNGLAGVFIWELGAGVTSDNQQNLLNDIRVAATGDNLIPAIPVLSSPPNDTEGSSQPLTLSWYPSDLASSYQVQVSPDQNFSNNIIDTTVTSSVSATIQNLNPRVKYFWRVNAVNNAGASSFTPPYSFVTSGPPLAAPNLFLPEDSDDVLPSNAIFKWSSSANAGSYLLELSTLSDFCDNYESKISTDTTITLNNLDSEIKYYWRVKAYPKDGSFSESSFSRTRAFNTSESLPDIPQAVSPVDGAEDISVRPVLIWKQAAHAREYGVRLSINKDLSSTVFDISGINQNQLKINNRLKYKTTYYWDVRSINGVGSSNWSPATKFTTGDSGGISVSNGTVPTTFAVRNYPNPFNNSTVIQFDVPFKCSVKLYISNTLGKRIKILLNEGINPGIYEIPFNGNLFASGVYFYTLMAIYNGKYGQELHNFVSGKMILLK